MVRELNDYERQLIDGLVERGLSPRAVSSSMTCVLVEDVAPEDKDWYHIRLSYQGRPWQRGPYSIIADWSARDLDGGVIELLVLGDEDGYPYEIEIRRPDLQPIRHLPPASSWA